MLSESELTSRQESLDILDDITEASWSAEVGTKIILINATDVRRNDVMAEVVTITENTGGGWWAAVDRNGASVKARQHPKGMVIHRMFCTAPLLKVDVTLKLGQRHSR